MTEIVAPSPAGTGYRAVDFELPDHAAELIEEAVPENTATAYRSRWRSFEAWCLRAGRVPLPATAQTVAAYLSHLATTRRLKATTIDAHLTAIRTVHRAAGRVPPDSLAPRKVVAAARKREARRDGRYGPRRALPVMAGDLPAIVRACDTGSPAGLRDRAVILLGFVLLARRSELAALNVSDVVLVPGEGLEVTIRSSKTDQAATGVVRRVHYAVNEAVCPVRAVLDWVSFLAGRGAATGPLFTRIDRWGHVDARAGGRYVSAQARDGRLRPQAIGDIVAAACSAAVPEDSGAAGDCGPPRRHTGHSLRRGGATSMLKAGAEPLTVSRHGRWTDGSRSFAGYIEEATGFGDDNPTKGLL